MEKPCCTKSASLYLDSILVVALHEQRPDLDADIVTTISEGIEAYRERLVEVTEDLATDRHGLPLFRPQTALLWGPYDHATFYLADDLESVEQISYGTGATAQEFLFGSPYRLGPDCEGPPQGLKELLAENGDSDLPLIAVGRLKLGDHLLSAVGGSLRAAVAQKIHEIATPHVVPIVLRCWSWHDLIVLLLGDDPEDLISTLRKAERLTVRDVLPNGSRQRQGLVGALDHPTPRQMLQLWVHGRQQTLESSKCPWDDKAREELLKKLDACDVLVSEKSQLGVTRSGWHRWGEKLLAGRAPLLYQALNCAFDPTAATFFKTQIREGKEFHFAKLLGDFVARQGLSKDYPCLARVVILPKPGHLSTVQKFVTQIVTESEKQGGTALSLNETCAGHGTSLVLHVEFALKLEGFIFLFCISHCFRVCGDIHHHLMDISTSIDWPQDPEDRGPKPKRPRDGSAESQQSESGFDLLRYRSSRELRDFKRFRTMKAGLNRVQGLALRALGSAVKQASTRPEIFGAIMELHDVTQALEHDLIYGKSDISRKTANKLGEVMPYAQKAYQQRLQFSPVLSGAPPLNGQLPYGVNQIVRTIDGITTILSQASMESLGKDRLAEKYGRSYRKLIIVFEADAAIAIRSILDFGVLKLSLLQALTPLSLTALFHELGHLMVRQWCWHFDGPESTSLPQHQVGDCIGDWGQAGARWKESYRQLAEAMASLDRQGDQDWLDRVKTFLNDIFAHAVWRRIGCGNKIELFRRQFLAVQAMGLRTDAKLGNPLSAIDAWALATIHLALQEALHSEGDDAFRAMSLFRQDCDMQQPRFELWQSRVAQAVEYCGGELHCAFERMNNDKGGVAETESLQKSLLARVLTWLPTFAWLCTDKPETSRYLRWLQSFFKSVESLDRSLRTKEQEFAESSATFSTIVERIRKGEPVHELAWEEFFDEGGSPTTSALLWIRQILEAVTMDFANSRTNGSTPRYIRRGRNFDFQREELAHRGTYADFIGGIFVAGREERQSYLRVRLAAIESLSELSSRALANSIRHRLLRRRRFKREDLPGKKAWIGLDDGSEIEGQTQNISAAGLCVLLPEGTVLNENDRIFVQTVHLSRLECRVAWAESCESGDLRIGAEISESPRQPDPLHKPRPQLETLWLKTT